MRPLAVGDKVRHKLSRHVGEVKAIDESGVTAVFNDGHATIHDNEPDAFTPVTDEPTTSPRSRYSEMVRADPVASKLLEEAADREIVELTLAPAYKVGDRVRLVREPFSGCDVPVGSVGVVADAWDSGGYDVRFDDIKIMCIASHLEAA